MKREKLLYPVLVTVIGGVVAVFVIQPLGDAYRPTADQILDLLGAAWDWTAGPGAWVVSAVAVCCAILFAAWRNMRRSRWVGLALCVSAGIAGGVVFRTLNASGYPADQNALLDPAGWIVLGGPLLWLTLAVFLPYVYRSADELLAKELTDRDWRWILREREGIVDQRGARQPKRHWCNVARHRPMIGYETCTHEARAARSRSRRARWRMEGALPQELKHPGSPGYDSEVKPSMLEPVLGAAELAELERARQRQAIARSMRRVILAPASGPTPGAVEDEAP
ncbi:MAG: hypothetical protein REI45_01950 [Propionicimonas sp.]|nr:hypothetical protein [Propionicimonas sp.]